MNHSRRHSDIMKLVQEEGTISIADLAAKLGVSLETVRRDVKPLTSDGAVVKMHGAIGLPSISKTGSSTTCSLFGPGRPATG